VWAQAAEKVGSLEPQAMTASLRQHQFDTVVGPIDFDEKGDLAVL
jgi:branched-chain amino acid transport system substrate-binding protein